MDPMPEEPLPQDPAVRLAVNSVMEGQPMQLYTEYDDINGNRISFDQLRLYISEFTLMHADGSETQIDEVSFYDLNGEQAVERVFNASPGDYAGFKYHIGVPEYLNSPANPDFSISVYDAEHPLNVNNGMYWAWASGYRFCIYDGRIDTTASDPSDISVGFSIHLGKDQYYTEVVVDEPFTIEMHEQQVIQMNWDVGKSFYSATDTLELATQAEGQFHGETSDLAPRFQNTLRASFSHDID